MGLRVSRLGQSWGKEEMRDLIGQVDKEENGGNRGDRAD